METPSDSLGERLRSRRLELGLTLEELAETTRIRRVYLIALEEDRPDAIPGEAYRIGFLRTYAGILGLKIDDLLPRQSAAAPVAITSPLIVPSEEPSPSKRGVYAALAAVLFVVAAFGAAALFRSAPEEPAIRAETVAAEEGAIAEETAPAREDEGGEVVESALFDETAGELDPAGEDQAPRILTTEVDTPAEVTAPEGERVDVIRLRALGPNRLELVLDHRPPQRYELKADTQLSWRVRRSALVRVDNPADVQIWFGDSLVDLQGKSQILLKASGGEEGGGP